jgi:ubiquinone/menaquinone biosynthesis C-methylase UbiE
MLKNICPMENQQIDEIKARDDQAHNYENWYLSSKGILFDWLEKKIIIDSLNLHGQEIVLDMGCGTGRLALEIANKCKKVYAVDFSPKSIRELNKKISKGNIKNIEAFVWDIAKPLQIPEKVDRALSIQVIQHIHGYSQRQKAVKNIYDQLKSNGICLVSVYNQSPIFDMKNPKEGKFSNGIYYFRFNPQEIKSLFNECGFIDISVIGFINFRWYYLLKSNLFCRIARPLAWVDGGLSKLKLSTYLGNYLLAKGIKQ